MNRSTIRVRIVSLALVVVALVVLAVLLAEGGIVEHLGAWLEKTGPWRAPLFVGAYVLLCLLLVPGAAVTLVGGALLGVPLGFAAVYAAAVVAAALAFLIGRYFARGPIERLARRHPAFDRVDGAIGEGGWKVVALLRLSPAVPFCATNYLFGLTRVRFWPYVGGTAISIPPGTLLYVWLGSAGRSGFAALRGGDVGSPWRWALIGAGLAATAALIAYVHRLARRRLEPEKAR